MDIGEVSKLTRLPASTLRYYEEQGLIQSIDRRGLKRLFAQDVFDTLALVTLGQNAGLSPGEISTVLLA